MDDSSDDDVFGLSGGYASRRPPMERTASLHTQPVSCKPYNPIRCLSSPASSRRLVRQSRLSGDPHPCRSSSPTCLSSSPPQRSQSTGRGSCSRSPTSRSSSPPSPVSNNRLKSSPIPISPLASPNSERADNKDRPSSSSPRPAPTFLRFGRRNDSLFAAPSRSESLQELFSESPTTTRRNILIDMFSWGRNRSVTNTLQLITTITNYPVVLFSSVSTYLFPTGDIFYVFLIFFSLTWFFSPTG